MGGGPLSPVDSRQHALHADKIQSENRPRKTIEGQRRFAAMCQFMCETPYGGIASLNPRPMAGNPSG
jgi:hypothetical protein